MITFKDICAWIGREPDEVRRIIKGRYRINLVSGLTPEKLLKKPKKPKRGGRKK